VWPAAVRPTLAPNPIEEHTMGFRIRGLPAETFAGLFSLSDESLAARGAVRVNASQEP